MIKIFDFSDFITSPRAVFILVAPPETPDLALRPTLGVTDNGQVATADDVAMQAQDLINRSRELTNFLNDQRHINATYVSGSMPPGTQPAPNTPLSNYQVESVSTNRNDER